MTEVMNINPRFDEDDGEPTTQSTRLIGSCTGIVERIRFENGRYAPDEPVVAAVESASMNRLLPESVAEETDFGAYGKGDTPDRARLSALGEFAERYCAHWYPVTECRTGTYRELREEGLDTVELAYLDRYEPGQLSEVDQKRFTASTTTEWVTGRRLSDGAPIYLPAELAYIRRTKRHFWSNSNGSACAEGFGAGVARGVYEVVERDAVMRSWFLDRTPTRLRLDSSPELKRRRESIAAPQGRVELLDLDAVGPFHAVGAAYVGDGTPKFVLVADANLRRRAAVEGALAELAQALSVVRSDVAFYDSSELDRIQRRLDSKSTLELGENVVYYLAQERFDTVAPLLEGGERAVGEMGTEVESSPERPEDVVETARRCGLTPIGVDLTTRDVRELGWVVVSVVVPELVPFARPGIPPAAHPVFEGRTLRSAPHPLG